MKNNFKFLLYVSFIYLVGTGCKENDITPQEASLNKFTVESSTLNHDPYGIGFVGSLSSPQLSFKDIPKGTKQFITVLEDNANFLYWSAAISSTVTDLEIVHSGTAPQYHHLDVMTTIRHYRTPRMINGATTCTLSIFALNAPLTEDEWAKIKRPEQQISREEFIKMLSITNNNRILGLAKAEYPIQVLQTTSRHSR